MTFDERFRALTAAFPCSVTSGKRSAAHNTAVGGVPNSLHLADLARDVGVVGNSLHMILYQTLINSYILRDCVVF